MTKCRATTGSQAVSSDVQRSRGTQGETESSAVFAATLARMLVYSLLWPGLASLSQHSVEAVQLGACSICSITAFSSPCVRSSTGRSCSCVSDRKSQRILRCCRVEEPLCMLSRSDSTRCWKLPRATGVPVHFVRQRGIFASPGPPF